ncbi:MAG: S-adenosylmethionine decarboxylase [Selenomonadaceae bacterium]|nr:S-adenosylmethionine decarboxylase [Selenomonadaceae bacterium]
MKILARQLTLDLYNCDTARLGNIDEIKYTLNSVVGNELRLSSEAIDEGHCSIIGAFAAGHIALHVYKELRYVAVDIFTCTESDDPEELAAVIGKFFRPDKTKSTFLKRGDFGLEREIKPKIKVRVAPLRRVKNAGAKVVKNLVRRGKE